jgi:hypothetical protein
MGCCIYYITKAPIGWSLFRDRERLGGHGSFASALEAVTKACTIDISERREVQINCLASLVATAVIRLDAGPGDASDRLPQAKQNYNCG